MNTTELLRHAARQKHITLAEFAERSGKTFNTLRNMLYKSNINTTSLEELADALGCDVVLIDRETGEIYR